MAVVWIVFYNGERELCAVTAKESFPGEIEATKEMLAAENNLPVESIRVEYEQRSSGHTSKIPLIKDKQTGDYFSADNHFWIRPNSKTFNVYEVGPDGMYEYVHTVKTLSEFQSIVKRKG